MGPRVRRSAFLTVLWFLSVPGQTPAQSLNGCKATDPNGYFEGTVKSREAGELSISLNLLCAGGKYEGDLLTPVGNFPIKDASFASGQLVLHFDAGDVGTITTRVEGDHLAGTFQLANDSGGIDLRRIGDPKPRKPTEATLRLTPAQWREDLKFFAEELPKRHANAFAHVSRQQFAAEVTALNAKLDQLNGDEAYAGIDRIAQMVGDGHTYVQFPPDTANFPIDIRQFGTEYRVAAVVQGNEQALGARVIKIENEPLARAHDLLMQFTPQAETKQLADVRIEDFLTMGMFLHAVGIIPDRTKAHYTLVDDNGEETVLEVHALTPNGKVEWVTAFEKRPLYRQHPGEDFWYQYLPDSRAVYCSFRGYAHLAENAKSLLEFAKQQHPEKLIIDMRQNLGGDFKEGQKYLIDPIRALPEINRKGHLFVLISGYTFSAGMSNAAQFRTMTAATLVGQTIGERPNSFQEAREMRLPNSHLVVRYSTQFYKFVESGENLIKPDWEVFPTWTEYKAGRDPVLARVLGK